MKLPILSLLLILGSTAAQWKDLRSPMDSPHYQEILHKLFPHLSNRGGIPNGWGKITNGLPAKLGQFPFQVYMYLYTADGSGFMCGGSIIHRRWILTAAHCVDKIVKVEVHLGAINRRGDGSPGAYIKQILVRDRSSIIKHPNYNPNTIGNDIGLIELSADAPIEHNYIGILALPQGFDATKNLINEIGTVSGFGRFSDLIAGSSLTLNYVELPIVSNTVCARTFGSAYVTEKHVCLQSVDKASTCQGDSGGPLTVIGEHGFPIQVGIVSYGAADGCELGYPDVFTRVTSFIPWIEATTKAKFS